MFSGNVRIVSAVILAIAAALTVGRVRAEPDCDGSTPKSDFCGTAVVCQSPAVIPMSHPPQYYCPNQRIEQQFIQYLCNNGSGTGSTLCSATSQDLVCTKRYTCVLEPLENPETHEVTYVCAAAMTGGINNSTAKKTDYTRCRDTSGGG